MLIGQWELIAAALSGSAAIPGRPTVSIEMNRASRATSPLNILLKNLLAPRWPRGAVLLRVRSVDKLPLTRQKLSLRVIVLWCGSKLVCKWFFNVCKWFFNSR